MLYFKIMVRCEDCPTGQRIDLYKRAGKDVKLATELNKEQGLPEAPATILTEHFRRTAETIFKLGCETQRACPNGVPSLINET